MVTSRVVRAAVCLSVVILLASSSFAKPVEFTLRGQVLSADGKPAAGAIVEQLGINQTSLTTTTADGEGRFSFADDFDDGVKLQARSADGREQAVFNLPAGSVRVEAAKAHTIQLLPAKEHTVTVTGDAKPVAEAEVVVTGASYAARGKTDSDGRAVVFVPAHRAPRSVAAYHPELGVGGLMAREELLSGDVHAIELLPPAPHEIRVIDDEGKPVAGLTMPLNAAATVENDSGWIVVAALASTNVRTDADGVAKVNWTPRNLRIVTPEIWGDQWKSDKLDYEHVKDGFSVQTVRRKYPVTGRVVVPEGVVPTGILVGGDGWGTGHKIDRQAVRVAADGTFTLMAVAGHSYILGVMDREWAADVWTGDVKTDAPADEVQIELKLYPATPLTVQVTRGPDHQPVANEYVSFQTERQLKFTGDNGQRQTAHASIGERLVTDANGLAKVGVCRGEHTVNLSANDWTEKRKVDVTSAEPVSVEFYRPWIGQRKLLGRLVDGGKPFTPSAESKILAWSMRPPRMPLQHEPKLLGDGKFELDFDSETAAIVFFDPAQQRCGAVEIGLNDTETTIDLKPTASYSGTLLNSKNQPVADQEFYLGPKDYWMASLVAVQTDATGKFHLPSVPSDVSLTARLRGSMYERQPYYITRGDRQFKPGENREKDRMLVRESGSTSVAKLPEVKLTESIATACRDGRLNHMGVFVLIEGDDSTSLRDLTARLLDADDTPDVYAYRVISVSPERAKSQAAELAARKWPTAAAGHAVVLVLDEGGGIAAELTIRAAERDESLSEARQLLAKHRPAQRDAAELLASAQAEAKASGRRLWVISGGPRCGPCFRLARWMDYQHALLEKDYVLVKVLGGVDKNAEVIAPLLPGSQSEGIPFHAIVEPDGKVLITSKGPLGNIGMPSDPEGVRHLRKMLEATAQKLTADEIAQLEKSLVGLP